MSGRPGEVRGRSGGWIVLACLLVVLSPLLQMLTTARGIPFAAVLAALAFGVVLVAVYLRALRRAQHNHPGPP
jgi:hypothetical protein